jgi:5-methylcytosine-specific restriction endonuclease McrA
MKERSYNFSKHVRSGPKVTKREIIESLQSFAREKQLRTFTQKAYDRWPKRVLCSSQIGVRFSGWHKAMEAAGLSPQWTFTKDPTEMVETYMDCWEEHDDAPTEKAFEAYLKKRGSKYTLGHYKRHFGGLRRLASRVVNYHDKRISESQLIERWEGSRKSRTPIPAALRYQVLRRDGEKCRICGKGAADGVLLEVDHIIPVSKGGSNDLNNLRTLCDICNRGRGDKE